MELSTKQDGSVFLPVRFFDKEKFRGFLPKTD